VSSNGSTQADDEGTQPQPGGFFCPYCAIQASPEAFLTKSQVELAENMVIRDVIQPEIERFGRDMRRQTGPGSPVSFELKAEFPEELDPLVEPNDMKRVEFICHSSEPVKVLDHWDRAVHCLICGRATSPI
jgi:hypothetical protein